VSKLRRSPPRDTNAITVGTLPLAVIMAAVVAFEATMAYAVERESTGLGATMARMIAEVYDALRSAGADEDKARAAATAVAGQGEVEAHLDQIGKRIDRIDDRLERLETRVGKVKTDLAVLKWMIGANIALTVIILGKLLTLG
jgi:hypothetical protein